MNVLYFKKWKTEKIQVDVKEKKDGINFKVAFS